MSESGRSHASQHTRRTALTPRRWIVALVAAVLPVAGLATTAEAAPTIEQVQKRVDDIGHQAEKATERYNAKREQLKGLKVRLAAAQNRQKRQARQVELARRELGRLAAETYKEGALSTLALFLDENADQALAEAGIVETLSDRRLAAIDRLRRQQEQLAAATADVGDQRREIDAALAALATEQASIRAKLAAAKAELSRLSAQQRQALARASRAAEARELREAVGRDVSPSSGCGDVGVPPTTARVKKVLAFACAQLGKPYLWGADGPDSFDCSGFTLRAWERAGVSLPHNSAMQARYGTRVAASQLQPGDLVFYYSPISHVGIYIGNKLMIDAPRSGKDVRITPVRYGEITAAVRL